MTGIHRIKLAALLFLLIFCLCLGLQPVPCLMAGAVTAQNYEEERSDGGYYTMLDSQRHSLLRTAHRLFLGDEYITASNFRYRVTSIKGVLAYSTLIGREKVADIVVPVARPISKGALNLALKPATLVAIYHTHSDESYVPTDGTSSIYAHGGIFKVGNAFDGALHNLGLQVVHSLRPHDPHDVNAYARSRRTAVQLLQQNPAALIDVHRDAVPPDVYGTIYRGKAITKVKLVIGRVNPRMSANLAFAKAIKAAVDHKSPNVIDGILLARGDYNQDLSPHAVLMEVGAHTNSGLAAQRGISILANALPEILGGGVGTPAPKSASGPVQETNRGAWRALAWIVLIVGVLAAGYLYINQGSWRGARDRLRHFWQDELGNRNKGSR